MTFADPVPQFTKDELDRMLVEAQQTSRELLQVERHMNASKEYLTKVRPSVISRPSLKRLTGPLQAMKHKDDAGGGPVDEDMFPPSMGMGMGMSMGMGMGMGGHGWADDVTFS